MSDHIEHACPKCGSLLCAEKCDPTPTAPAAPARSAREVIQEVLDSAAVVAVHGLCDESAWECDSYKRRARAFLTLRALLDAPQGSVERLCEAADVFIHSLVVHEGHSSIPHPDSNHGRFRSALAAVRASPEAVGAGASEAPSMAVTREVTALRRERDALKDERDAVKRERREMDGALEALTAERDALKADLAAANDLYGGELERADKAENEQDALRTALEAAQRDLAEARGEVERVERIRDAALKLIRAVDDALSGRAEDPVGVDQRAALRYARDNLGIAFSWKEAPRPATPPLAIRVPCAANGCRWDTTDPSGRCAAHRDGWAEKTAIATPPPASEAISERARWIADAALRLAVADVGWSPSDDDERCSGPKIVQEGGDGLSAGYVEAAVEILAASERAAKAPAPAEGS